MTTISKSFYKTKEEWNVYGKRFSFIDDVLDAEYNFFPETEKTLKAVSQRANGRKALKWVSKKVSHTFYSSYLFIWFSLYFTVSMIGKLLK